MTNEQKKLRGIEIFLFMQKHNIIQECPRCGSRAHVRNGNSGGVVKLKCKACGNNFSSLINTIFEGCDYTIQEMKNIVYDLAFPAIFGRRIKHLYDKKCSHSKTWLINHKIMGLISDMAHENQNHERTINVKFKSLHKGTRRKKQVDDIVVSLFIKNDNVYVSTINNIDKSVCENYNDTELALIQKLNKYLYSIERGVSEQYIIEYINWFSYANDIFVKFGRTLNDEMISYILVDITRYSLKQHNVKTLKSIVPDKKWRR